MLRGPPGRRHPPANAPRRLQAVQLRHVHVHQHDIVRLPLQRCDDFHPAVPSEPAALGGIAQVRQRQEHRQRREQQQDREREMRTKTEAALLLLTNPRNILPD
jgi:hypothetical protein